MAHISSAARDGGFSRSLSTGEAPSSGYMVGGVSSEHSIPLEDTNHLPHRVRKHLESAQAMYGKRADLYQGGWKEGNRLVMDVSERYDDRDQALNVARQRGERAIYHLDSGSEIPT